MRAEITGAKYSRPGCRPITPDVRALVLLILTMGLFNAGTALGGAAELLLWAMAFGSFMLALE